MSERIAVVTGTTAGIGREIARGLAKAGMTVVVHGRDPAKLEAVEADLRGTGAAVHGALADLSSKADVKRLARELADRFGRVDVLVNNAATVPHTRKVTAEGLEATFATNVLAPYLL